MDEGENQVTFRVSSKAMCLASPVWRVMLDPSGPFKEARPENDSVLFPEDDAQALQILLYIAHLQFHSIPETLSFTQLLNLAIICDKYDTARLLFPWFHKWGTSFRDSALELGHECSLSLPGFSQILTLSSMLQIRWFGLLASTPEGSVWRARSSLRLGITCRQEL